MALELVYTSAPSGIKTGATGFCVVACTKGMGPRLITVLEGLSAYKPVFPHYHENAWDNPVACSHYIANVNGSITHILSRTCFNGVDHTQRSNKLASFLALNHSETTIAAGGPASLFLIPGMFKDASWKIEPELFPSAKTIPQTYAETGKCSLWESLTGDAGWGGALVDRFINNPQQPVYIVFDPIKHKNLPELMQESLALLPEENRWQVTFSTYFVSLPAGMTCSWRCCTPDADCLVSARRTPGTLIIDLTQPLPAAPAGEYVTVARTGIRQEKQFFTTPLQIQKVESEETVAVEQKKKLSLRLSGLQKTEDLYGDYMSGPPTHYRKKKSEKEKKKAQSIVLIKTGIIAALVIFAIAFLIICFVKINSNQSEKSSDGDSQTLSSDDAKNKKPDAPQDKAEQNKKAPKTAQKDNAPQDKAEQNKKAPKTAQKDNAPQDKAEQNKKDKNTGTAAKKDDQKSAETKNDEQKSAAVKQQDEKTNQENQAAIDKFRTDLNNARKLVIAKYQVPKAKDIKKIADLQKLKIPTLKNPSEEHRNQMQELEDSYDLLRKDIYKKLENLQSEAQKFAWIEGQKLFGDMKKATFYVGAASKDQIILRWGAYEGKGELLIVDNKGNDVKFLKASVSNGILTLTRLCDSPRGNKKISFQFQNRDYFLTFNHDESEDIVPEKMTVYYRIRKKEVFFSIDPKWRGSKEFSNIKNISKNTTFMLDKSSCTLQDEDKINEAYQKIKEIKQAQENYELLKNDGYNKIVLDVWKEWLNAKKKELGKKYAQKTFRQIHQDDKNPELKELRLAIDDYFKDEIDKCPVLMEVISKAVDDQIQKKENLKELKFAGFENVQYRNFPKESEKRLKIAQKNLRSALLSWVKKQTLMRNVNGIKKTHFKMEDVKTIELKENKK